MRKFLEGISLLSVAAVVGQTGIALYGPNRLPDQVPTHFDLAGRPNAWGPSGLLLTLPVISILLYLGISLVSRFPNSFNYPVRVTAQNRLRLQAIALNMVAFLKAETLCLFALLQFYTLQSARSARLGLPPYLMLSAIALIFLTMGYHVYAMRGAR